MRTRVVGVLAAALPVLLGFGIVFAQQKVYKWVDSEGVVHVTSNPADIPDEYVGRMQEQVFKAPTRTKAAGAPAPAPQVPAGVPATGSGPSDAGGGHPEKQAQRAARPAENPLAGGKWNEKQIRWYGHDQGLSIARSEGKPICLVIFTEWCSHSTKYSSVFRSADVVERSKRFVMVRLDADKNPQLDKKYAPDGTYVPRTFFLTSSGVLDPSIHARRKSSIYFFDDEDPSSILAGMDEAMKKLR